MILELSRRYRATEYHFEPIGKPHTIGTGILLGTDDRGDVQGIGLCRIDQSDHAKSVGLGTILVVQHILYRSQQRNFAPVTLDIFPPLGIAVFISKQDVHAVLRRYFQDAFQLQIGIQRISAIVDAPDTVSLAHAFYVFRIVKQSQIKTLVAVGSVVDYPSALFGRAAAIAEYHCATVEIGYAVDALGVQSQECRYRYIIDLVELEIRQEIHTGQQRHVVELVLRGLERYVKRHHALLGSVVADPQYVPAGNVRSPVQCTGAAGTALDPERRPRLIHDESVVATSYQYDLGIAAGQTRKIVTLRLPLNNEIISDRIQNIGDIYSIRAVGQPIVFTVVGKLVEIAERVIGIVLALPETIFALRESSVDIQGRQEAGIGHDILHTIGVGPQTYHTGFELIICSLGRGLDHITVVGIDSGSNPASHETLDLLDVGFLGELIQRGRQKLAVGRRTEYLGQQIYGAYTGHESMS